MVFIVQSYNFSEYLEYYKIKRWRKYIKPKPCISQEKQSRSLNIKQKMFFFRHTRKSNEHQMYGYKLYCKIRQDHQQQDITLQTTLLHMYLFQEMYIYIYMYISYSVTYIITYLFVHTFIYHQRYCTQRYPFYMQVNTGPESLARCHTATQKQS